MGTSSQRQTVIHETIYQERLISGRKGNAMTKAAIRWANDKTKAKHRVRACEIDTQLDLDARKVPIELAERPTSARPGEYRKVVIIAARYRYGLPLQHPMDCEGAIYCENGQYSKA